MPTNELETFVGTVRSHWGPLSSELTGICRPALLRLANASPAEPWLAGLLERQPANEELHRDPDHGFMLLAHTEREGLYRPPHDHGRAWVAYAVQSGEVEMRTFGARQAPDGQVRLVQRDSAVLRQGAVQVYLPGDIHDTRCLSPSALLFRFTERDLKAEDRIERRLTRYAPPEGAWTIRP
jgi:hypothetical protein